MASTLILSLRKVFCKVVLGNTKAPTFVEDDTKVFVAVVNLCYIISTFER